MNPGEGAIAYARELTLGMTRKQAALIVSKLLTEDSEDRKIKRCTCCGYPFRDATRNNSAKVCGKSCKTDIKSAQRAVQRGAKVKIKMNKPITYTWWLEYPYWLSEKAMLSHTGSYERPYSPEKMAQISAAKGRTERTGGHKRRSSTGKYEE